MISLESLQSILTDLTSLFQFAGALLGLCAIILPLLRTLPFYHSLIYWTDVSFTLFLHALSRISSLFTLPYSSSSYSSLEELTQDPLTICLASTTSPTMNTLVSGLSNTGNTCFLNSVLQAISSLPSLHQYLYTMRNPNSPVSNTLFKTIRKLSKPEHSRSSIRPSDLVRALSTQQTQASAASSGFRRRSTFLTNRRQQDAQEFFQVLMDAVDTEAGQQLSTKEPQDTGLTSLTTQKPGNKDTTHDPLSGLLASQLSCVHCGYVGTIRHFTFNNIQLSLPNSYSATIESCLKQYTAIEYLRDATCRQCSLLTTSRMMAEKVGTLKRQAKHMQKNKDKKRELVTEMVSLEKARMELEQRLRSNQIDSSDDEDTSRRKNSNRIGHHSKIKYHRTISPRSTKQVMIAKLPPSLCLHMTRSAMHQSGMIFKNTCQLLFDEYLDLTPFVVHGTLDNHTLSPLSSFAETNKKTPNRSSHLYRLMSVVVHYGGHSYGHYIAYKRRILPHDCHCHSCSKQNQQHEKDSSIQQKDINNKSTMNRKDDTIKGNKDGETWNQCQMWYRISDSKVDPCTLDDILSSNPYMLFYERVDSISDEGKTRSARYQAFDHRSSYTYDDGQSDSYSDYSGNDTTEDSGDNDNDDDTSSDLHQPISPATPLDDDDGDFSPSYYSDLTGTSLEALEMANALLNMDRQEPS